MKVTKLTIEYDGADFAGWARQPDKRTVQGELERALHTILGDRTRTARRCGSPSRGAPTAACTPGGRSRATRTRRWTRCG